jgi:gliding motility-associated lipoprotein GldH
MRFVLKNIFPILIFVSLASCDRARIYEVNQDLDEENWEPSDTLTFEFNIPEDEEKYNLYYNIRYSTEYRFYNLFTRYFLLDSAGNLIKSPKLPEDMYLFDQKTGKPNGSGIGNYYDQQVSFLSNYIFPYPGKYSLKVVQYMRDQPISGVRSFGLRIEKASQKKN